MLARTYRFHGYGSLRHVYKHGQTVRSSLLSVRYHENQRRSAYRAAIVISKKTEKSAVKRNRIRRRIYRILRLNDTKINKPYDIVITVFNANAAKIPTQELNKSITDLLNQAGITSKT